MRRALISLACLGLALTACADAPSAASGSEDLVAILRDASERTLEAGSARVDFAFDVESGERTQALRGTAEFVFGDGDPAQAEAHLTLEVPATGQDMPGGTVEVILDRGPVLYVNAEMLASVFPVPTPWIKLDPAAMGEGWGELSSLGGAQTDPSSSLGLLFGALDVQEVGPETIEGVAATHYRATIDLEAALEHAPDGQRPAVRQAIAKLREQSGGEVPELPIDIWIADGLLKRVSFTFATGGTDEVDGGASMSATLTLSDVGGSFTIDPPPADQVTDLSELAGMWGQAVGAAPAA